MPTLHYFNPGHETAVLNGSPYYMPSANVACMQKELAFLPAWYAAPRDYVLVDTLPPAGFLNNISKQTGIDVTPLTHKDIINYGNTLPPCNARPWGISPQSLHVFEQLRAESGWSLTVPEWDDAYTRLCGRQTAAICVRSLLNVLPEADKRIVPRFRSTLQTTEEVIQNSTVPQVLKAPYSSSGRGLRWIQNNQFSIPDRQWVSGILKKQGSISIEPALNKKLDFAMEFFSSGSGNISYEGLSLFVTGEQGAYTGNFLGSQAMIEQQITNLTGKEILDEVRESLMFVLQDIYSQQYTGYLGVDMMVYEDANGKLRIHPCVEINMRYTMGVVALRISEQVLANNVCGKFIICYHAKESEALQLQQELEHKFPACFINQKLVSGYLSLCPVSKTSKYSAYLIISNTEV